MGNFFLYQVTDSSKKAINELELLEEVDEPMVLLKPKKYFPKIKYDSSKIALDTFYGIKNGEAIPVRKIELIAQEKSATTMLFNPTPLVINVASWQVVILLVSIVLIGFSKAFSSSRFKQSIRALMRYSVAQEICREEKVFFHRANVLFTVIHLLVTTLLIFHIIELSKIQYLAINHFLLILSIMGGIIGTYVIKYFFSRVLFFILNDNSIASEYIFNVSLYNSLLGVLLIPGIIIAYFTAISFSSIFLYALLPIIALAFCLRLIRLFVIGKSKEISYFYIFLYICTLEILPLVVLYRIFIL